MEQKTPRNVAESFVVVVDGSPESEKALRFAALRALHTGTRVMLVSVVRPQEFLEWGSVQTAMEEEAEGEAWDLLNRYADKAEELTGVRPAAFLRKGKLVEEILDLIESDRSIRTLVLGAAAKGRPGPLVDFFAGERAGSLPCLVMIIPGGLEDEDLDRLT